MYLPQIEQKNNNRSYINVFKGYNHNRRIDDAEFYDMKNMTADEYPILTSRDPRPCVLNIASDEYEERIYRGFSFTAICTVCDYVYRSGKQ